MESLDADAHRERRRSTGAKRLIEEVMPLAALLKHLEIPRRHIRCKYAGDDGNYDAQIKISGPEVDREFLKPEYFVEVTSAISPVDHFRREALSRYGSVFGGPAIKRVGGGKGWGKGEIVSEPAAEDLDTPLNEAIDWVNERLMEKAKKEYPCPCILAVNVEADRPFNIDEWASLAQNVAGNVDRDRFERTFIISWHENVVFSI
jgi:hypothetical protein